MAQLTDDLSNALGSPFDVILRQVEVGERNLVATLLAQVPPVAAAVTVAKQLNALLRRKTSESLTAILDAAVATTLKNFAAGLRRDVAAVQAELDERCSRPVRVARRPADRGLAQLVVAYDGSGG